ncbi:MAG: AAA family ATPase [Bacteroidales bacterium]|nr:AAA family ATPase [Bacteroidales bacterium]
MDTSVLIVIITFTTIIIAVCIACLMGNKDTVIFNNAKRRLDSGALIGSELLFYKGYVYHHKKNKDKQKRNEILIASPDLTEQQENAYRDLLNKFDDVRQCNKIWCVMSMAINNERKSAAKYTVDRKSAKFEKSNYHFVRPTKNIDQVIMVSRVSENYYIYPGFIVKTKVNEPINFEIIPLDGVSMSYTNTRFIESGYETVPKDATIVGHTYQYVNKNGAPDARYANNPKFPICLYGEITISKLSLEYHLSKTDVGQEFVNAFRSFQKSKETINKLVVGQTNPIEFKGNIFGITEMYYNSVIKESISFSRFFNVLQSDTTIINVVKSIFKGHELLNMIVLSDIVIMCDRMEYNTSTLKSKEGFAIVVLGGLLFSKDGDKSILTIPSFNDMTYFVEISKIVENLMIIVRKVINGLKNYHNNGSFIMSSIFDGCQRNDYKLKYLNLLYRFFSIVAKADNTITENEKLWLEKLMALAKETKKGEKTNIKIEEVEEISGWGNKKTNVEQENQRNPLEILNALIGLASVKNEINNLSNFVKIQRVREERGMKTSNVSYHCVFTGNPGTGKTTVARIVAEIYQQLGVLKKGHLVETDRSGLVAEYVGQTAHKTNAIIDSALDGVLFIDEAYTLVQGSQNDYGMEAIATLLKRMEDDRDRLVVILAGYTKEMEDFINSNSGLQSRFNRYIKFPDYSSDELMQIFMFILKNNDFEASEEALRKVHLFIDDAVKHKDSKFGNGRFVRNLFEKIITQQANRLTAETAITNELLSKIELSDVESAIGANS